MPRNEAIERVYGDHFKQLFDRLDLHRTSTEPTEHPPTTVHFKNKHFIASLSEENGSVECCLLSLFAEGQKLQPLPVSMFYVMMRLTRARGASDETRLRLLRLTLNHSEQARFIADYTRHIEFLLNKSNFKTTWDHIEGLFAAH